MAEGNTKPPDIGLRRVGQAVFPKRLAAGIKTRIVRAKAEVGRVHFGKCASVGARAGVNASR